MLEINLLLLVSVILVCMYFTFRFKVKNRAFLLVDSYLIGILFYAVGATYLYYETPIFKFEAILTISLAALISSIIGSLIYLSFNRKNDLKYQFFVFNIDYKVNDVLLFFSVLVSLFFIYAVLSNPILLSQMIYSFSDQSSSYNSVRKSITSGTEGYFAPGYVKQFRDIMGPIALVSLILLKPKNYKKNLLISFPIILLAMLLSGQRSIIVVFLLLYFFSVNYSKKILNSKNIIFGFFFIGVFYFLSRFIGRTKSLSFFDAIGNAAFSFFERVVLVVPFENSVAFDFWWNTNTKGLSWLSEIERILPGSDGGVSNLLHSLNNGSMEGNSVLGLPIDVYYAFGYSGVIVLPFLYALLIGKLDSILRKSNSIFMYVSRIFLFISLPFIYSPYGFLLYGGAFVLILKILLNKLYNFSSLKYVKN